MPPINQITAMEQIIQDVWNASTHQLSVAVSGAGSGGTSSNFNTTFPAAGTAVGASNGTNMVPLLVDGSGYLEVNVKAGSGSGLSVVDEATFTAGTSNFVPGGGVFNDSVTALSSGQQGAQRLTAQRAGHVNLRNNSGTEIGTTTTPIAGNLYQVGGSAFALGQTTMSASLPVTLASNQSSIPVTLTSTTITGTVAATQSGTWNVGLSAGTNLVGKVGIDQTTLGTTNNVSVSGSTGAGTSALIKDDASFGDGVTSGVLTTINRLWNGTTYDRMRSVITATGSTGTGVLGAGILALGKTANPTAVTDGQQVQALADKLGKQVVVGSIRDLKVNQVTTITTSTSETTVLSAVASTFLDVYGVIVTNTSATNATVAFKDSTTGTTQFNVAVPAGDTRGFMLPESGGIKQGTVNNNWTATTQSVTSIIITMLAVKNI